MVMEGSRLVEVTTGRFSAGLVKGGQREYAVHEDAVGGSESRYVELPDLALWLTGEEMPTRVGRVEMHKAKVH
jgi:hypothetical protein